VSNPTHVTGIRRSASRLEDLLGVAYARTGDFPDAIADFTTVVRLDPQNPEARRTLEQLRARLKK
jgi:Flp pilus assembly protein TadD